MLYVRKVLVVIKSGEKNKTMEQGGRGWWEERRKKPAKINHGDYSPTRPLGIEIYWEESCDVSVICFLKQISLIREID